MGAPRAGATQLICKNNKKHDRTFTPLDTVLDEAEDDG
jgi:hypothetical protein